MPAARVLAPDAVPQTTRNRRRRWPEHWPLTVALVGFPLWWIAGLSGVIAILAAVPMAVQLARRRRVFVPPGFGWWVLFLVCVVVGVLTLWADAPGAVPGGGASRLMVWGYRVAWYLACTIALLWAANSDPRSVSERRVFQLFGWMFVVTAAGGLLGVMAPTLELRSLVELFLPGGLRSNSLVRGIVHPGVADIQTVLGRPEARPKAPFAFANSWGANISLYLPFFLVAWLKQGKRWQRLAAPLVLAVAAMPIVYSLNRGLWASLGLGAAFVVARQVVRGNVVAIVGTALVGGIAVAAFLLSPLSDLVGERLENQHSNDRRGQLLSQTVSSTFEGSPVIGFGSTRDVQGSFASIAGASTPECPACGVPPLGTQGHIWLVIFSQGFLGTFLFLALFVTSLWRTWRCRTTIETVCTCLLLFFALQMWVYDTLGMPLFTIMLTIGLVWRSQHPDETPYRGPRRRTLQRMVRDVWAARRVYAAAVAIGILVAGVAVARQPQQSVARTSVLLAPSPVYLTTAIVKASALPRDITIDTEAALVFSAAARDAAASGPAGADDALTDRIRVTAAPRTRVLNIDVRSTDPRRAEAESRSLTERYLELRRDYLEKRRDQMLEGLRDRLAQMDLSAGGTDDAEEVSADVRAREREAIDSAINNLILTSTTAGEVVRANSAVEVRKPMGVLVASGIILGIAAAAVLSVLAPRVVQAVSRPGLRRRRLP